LNELFRMHLGGRDEVRARRERDKARAGIGESGIR
jgi:hypothetical protein